MRKLWHDEAWEEYLYWQSQDKKTSKKINRLLTDIDRNGYQCTGKPEPLGENLAGYWSVRIADLWKTSLQHQLLFIPICLSPFIHCFCISTHIFHLLRYICDTPTRVLANGRGFLRHGRTPQRAITSPLHPVTSLPLSRLLSGCLF